MIATSHSRWFVLFGDGKVSHKCRHRYKAVGIVEGRNRVHQGQIERGSRRIVAPAVALIHCIPKKG